jgi:curved DNA-binding protein
MDYYKILGVNRNSSDDEIKKAYRSLAMSHHPDRGGDEVKFKEISNAYDVLSDPQKRKMYDLGGDPNQNQGFGGFHHFTGDFPFEFSFGGPGGFNFHQQRRNTNLTIQVELTLEDVLKGKEVNAEITIPNSHKRKMINISIPPGVENGQQIRYQGMGDDSIAGIHSGDLIVHVIVANHNTFTRNGMALIVEKTINVWEALLGSTVEINTLDGKVINVTIPPGTQPDTLLSCSSEGLPHSSNKSIRGNLLIKIKIKIPTLNNSQLALILQVQNS